MFPFHLRGPEFLGFYAALVFAAAFLAWRLRRRGDPESMATERIQDPYLLAFLCRGRGHMLRVAVLSLIDRELLQVSGSSLRTAGAGCVDKSPRPLDQAILESYLAPHPASDVFHSSTVLRVAADYEQQLADMGYLPDGRLKRRRLGLFFAIALPLLAVAMTKIIVAVKGGHFNIVFLVVLTIVSPIVIYAICNPFRTRAGGEAVRQAKELFAGLKLRGKSLRMHEPSNELVLLAAVFGMTILPAAAAEVMKPIKMYQDTTGSSCGSSCGSSGCGGGGCGGGCGGCGGG